MQKQKKFHKAKKSLGQNFLRSEAILKKIVEAGEISEKDLILEIGPGKGSLTKKLLEKAGKVIAVEKDRNLFKFLQEKFKKEISEKKLILLEGDILKLTISEKLFSDSSQKFSTENFFCPSSTLLSKIPSKTSPLSQKSEEESFESENISWNYKIIANIPYNITGTILKKFLTGRSQPSMMVLMIQKEVAERIISRDNKNNLLSLSVKAYGEPKLIMKVGAMYFSPKPKVASAIISIKNISRRFFEENNLNENTFWEIIKAGFAHKRKVLIRNLAEVRPRQDLEKKFLKCGIETKTRAENLTLKDWSCLID
jgi:16S rRNA (adenine1518-N6/adenine1519-N6)-dimethyltransferase